MGLRSTGAARLDEIGFEREIPFGGAVRVVDQHEARIVFQALGLADHRFLILPQKGFGESAENEYGKRNIPRGDEIDAAKIAANRSDGGAAGKPKLAGLNDFGAHVGENEVDGGGDGSAGHFFEQLVGRAVGAGRMWTHAKAVRNRLEFLFFFVNATAAAPEPGLMHERAVSRVH